MSQASFQNSWGIIYIAHSSHKFDERARFTFAWRILVAISHKISIIIIHFHPWQWYWLEHLILKWILHIWTYAIWHVHSIMVLTIKPLTMWIYRQYCPAFSCSGLKSLFAQDAYHAICIIAHALFHADYKVACHSLMNWQLWIPTFTGVSCKSKGTLLILAKNKWLTEEILSQPNVNRIYYVLHVFIQTGQGSDTIHSIETWWPCSISDLDGYEKILQYHFNQWHGS